MGASNQAEVTTFKGEGYVRFTVKSAAIGWYEGWVYPDGRPSVFAVSCTPVRALPADAGGDAVRAAMSAYRVLS